MGTVNTLADYSVFSPEYVNKVITDMVVDPQTYGLIDQYIPTVDQDVNLGTEITWDEETYVGGMTAPADVAATSPLIATGGGRTKKWSPPHFREKTVISGTDLLNMRKLGTSNQMRQLGEEVNKWLAYLRTRIDNRMYWLKWEAVQNSTSFNVVGNNTVINLDYSGVGYHPQPGVSWDGANPTILDDIIGFVSQFRNSACYPQEAVFGTTVLQAMIADPSIRTLINAQIGNRVNDGNIFNVTPGNAGLVTFLQSMFGGLKFSYYNAGPVVSVTIGLPNAVGAAQDCVVSDGPLELFAAGDSVTVIRPNGTKTTVTLTAVTLASRTLRGPGVCERGTIIRKRMEFMHNDRFVMFAKMPPGQLGGQDTAQFINVANFHGEGGIGNMQSGIVGRVINKETDDPPHIDLLASFTGGVCVFHTDGPWLAGKVIF